MARIPRLLTFAVALGFAVASPYVAGAQATSQSSPASQAGRAAAKPPAPAPKAPAPKPAAPVPPAPAAKPPSPAATGGKGAAPAPPASPKPAPPAPAVPAVVPAPAAAAPKPAPALPAGPQLEPQGYTYDPAGRRDPFISLLQRGSDTQRPTLGARGAGLAGLDSSEVTLKGTIASQGGFVGILQGADNKTYIVRAGDKLADGTIRAITQDSMVITQQVTDPLSLEKTREVRKVLRQTEEAK
jgi:Tfp pilus assembly protein PilP